MKCKLLALTACAAALFVRGAEPVRRFVISDESRGRIHYYDSSDPAKCFFLPAEKTTWDLQLVGSRAPGTIGRYRYVCRNGFKVVDMDARKEVDEFRHPSLGGISSVSDLPDGGFLACVNAGNAVLVRKFSQARELVATYTFAGITNARTMQLLPNGELVIAHETGFTHGRLPAGDRDSAGIVVRSGTMPHGRNMFHARPTRDGRGYWAGAGYAAEVVRFGLDGRPEQVWNAPAKDGLKGVFFAEVEELADGHVLVANWTGHGAADSQKGWQLIEFDAHGKVVWTLHDPKRFGSVHGFVVLEAPNLPLTGTAAAWELNPIGWKDERARGSIRVKGAGAFAVAETTRAAETTFRVRVTPEAANTNGWATLGLSLYDDDRNFWHVALVRTPPENGERHIFELCEMRGGVWLSESADRLVCTERTLAGGWDYGQTYELALVTTSSGIRGEVKDAAGQTLFVCAFAFPTAAADGTVPAVTCGRLGLHSTGGFKGAFTRPRAVSADARPQPRPTFPAYQSDSFVPEVKATATGFFRVEEKDGRWWVIDPFGRGMVLLGVDHVTYWGHYSQRIGKSHHHEAMKAKFPNKADWEADTLKRLKAWGFNLLGAGCDVALKYRGLVHTIFLSVGDSLCWDASNPDYFICPNEHRPCSAFPNVFHPDFAVWADACARKSCAPNRDDPWLFGYFIDNELAWWGRGRADTGLFDAVAALPETHSARIAQKKFLAERGVTGSPGEAVKLDFLKLAADLYFRLSSEAIRRHDPNHLVMGARFAGLGGAHPAVWEISGKYCDVVTFNCYPWADLDRNVMFTHRGATATRITDAFAQQYAYVKRPMLVTEWSFPALDSGLPCTGGAGQRFRTQKLRTQATELFAKTMLSLPFLVGYDYFMWVDEPPEGISDAFPEDSNYGLINEKGEAYPEITQMFARLHRDVGAWRKAAVPAETAVPETRTEGETADRFLARINPGVGRATFTRDGDAYVIRNAAGLELCGRVGGRDFFEQVRLDGRDLGRYTAMLNDRVGGSPRWTDIAKVTAAELVAKDGRVVLTVTGERPGREFSFALTHRITVFADKPWFLCELIGAKNLGTAPLDVDAFFFREYSPFFADKLAKDFPKSVPNLWQAPAGDAWVAADGAFFGGFTRAPTSALFSYHIMDDGRSQHPDAAFSPERPLVLAPGATYAPKGTTWMLALCGTGGAAAWTRLVESF